MSTLAERTAAAPPRERAGRPKVSVVMACYNSAPTLRAAIDSARAQTLREIEIVVLDNCSTDDGRAIAQSIAEADPRVQVVPMAQNEGKPRAINLALPHLRGDWVAILDADDSYHPERLQRLVALGEQHGVAMVADDQHHIDGATGRIVTTAFQGHRFANPVDKAAFLRLATRPYREFDLGILKTVTRADFMRAHALRYREDATLGEDFYFLLEFFCAGGTLWIEHAPLYRWTLPFSPSTRAWTTTGNGAWRYDFRRTLPAHQHFVALMRARGDAAALAMLEQRGRRMRRMIHYTDAQRAAAEGRPTEAARILASHPSTYPILARRVLRRLGRGMRTRLAGSSDGDR